jgi:hypothetical protein
LTRGGGSRAIIQLCRALREGGRARSTEGQAW